MEDRKDLNPVNIPEKFDLNDAFSNKLIALEGQDESITLMHKAVLGIPIFKELINKTEIIDFELVASKGEVGALRERIKNNSDHKIIVTLEKKIASFMPDEDGKYVIIIRYILFLADKIGCGLVINNASFFIYNGNHWQAYDLTLLEGFLELVASKVGIDWIKVQQYGVKEKLLKQFISTATFKETPSENIKINLLNGTYHIDDGEVGELREARKEDFIKYKLNFSYDPNAEAPQFKKFLDRVLPDENCQNVLFEFLGYSFTNLKLEKALFLYGPGGNGKSVVFEVIKSLFGDNNICHHSMDDLCDNKGYHRANLGNKLLNYLSETGSMRDMEMFKKFISGEPIDARLPYGRPFSITRYCKFMYNVNILPNVEQTAAFYRRQLIIPFTQTIPLEEQDIDLHNKIIETELSGVFNLVLNGLRRVLRQRKFTSSDIIEEQINQYKKESNNVRLFLDDEGWIPSLTQKRKLVEFYPFYRNYCLNNGYRPVSNNKLGGRLRELGYSVNQGAQSYFYVWVEREEDKLNVIKGNEIILSQFLNNDFPNTK